LIEWVSGWVTIDHRPDSDGVAEVFAEVFAELVDGRTSPDRPPRCTP
jgi:hypothetical protein